MGFQPAFYNRQLDFLANKDAQLHMYATKKVAVFGPDRLQNLTMDSQGDPLQALPQLDSYGYIDSKQLNSFQHQQLWT